ncbi:MAG: aminoacyl-tRNA hydrolase [Kiritimatiellae bacterium]|nr:aminoacyl-tRNA hydrolase [Kiritimatiellia bacterium]
MKIVAGLGNPGETYAGTPHNVGFDVLELLAARLSGTWRLNARFKARLSRVKHEGEAVLLAQPQTFMNLSGDAIGPLMRYYDVAPEELTVVMDDADLPVGRLRIRAEGGAGGHRGLISVIAACGTQAFARVRVGIGRGAGGEGLIEHVLGRLDPARDELLRRAVAAAADAVLCLAARGVTEAMNRFNGWNAADAEQPAVS